MPTVFWCFRLPLSILESRSAEISPISLTSSVTGARRLKFSGRRIFAYDTTPFLKRNHLDLHPLP